MGKLGNWLNNPQNSGDLLLAIFISIAFVINNLCFLAWMKIGGVPASGPLINVIVFMFATIFFGSILFFLIYVEIVFMRKKDIVIKNMNEQGKNKSLRDYGLGMR